MEFTILDMLPYIVTIITCYVTIRVCLNKHDLQIGMLEKKLDELATEVKRNNEVKNRVSVLEVQMTSVNEKLDWIKNNKIE